MMMYLGKGFSLMEVLLVLFLQTMLVMSLLQFLNSTIVWHKALDWQLSNKRDARWLIALFKNDIRRANYDGCFPLKSTLAGQSNELKIRYRKWAKQTNDCVSKQPILQLRYFIRENQTKQSALYLQINSSVPQELLAGVSALSVNYQPDYIEVNFKLGKQAIYVKESRRN